MLEFGVFSRHLWNSSKFWRKILLIFYQILWTLDRFHSFNIVRKHTCQLWPSVIPLTSFHTSRTSGAACSTCSNVLASSSPSRALSSPFCAEACLCRWDSASAKGSCEIQSLWNWNDQEFKCNCVFKWYLCFARALWKLLVIGSFVHTIRSKF